MKKKNQQPVNWIRILVNMLLFIEKKKNVEVVNINMKKLQMEINNNNKWIESGWWIQLKK